MLAPAPAPVCARAYHIIGSSYQALCKLGINSDTKSSLTCPEDPDLEFTALFGRSLSDTFGNPVPTPDYSVIANVALTRTHTLSRSTRPTALTLNSTLLQVPLFVGMSPG